MELGACFGDFGVVFLLLEFQSLDGLSLDVLKQVLNWGKKTDESGVVEVYFAEWTL